MRSTKRGTYITGLRLRNIKSFEGDHHLDLTTEDGKIARWTLILGDNGVGKTTLLQCLAHLAPFRNTRDEDGVAKPTFFIEPGGSSEVKTIEQLARIGEHSFLLEGSFVGNGILDEKPTPRVTSFTTSIEFTKRQGKVESFEASETVDVIKREPLVIAYGAGRKLGHGALDRDDAGGPLASLFDDQVELCDAEELIQQLDYAAYKRQTKQAARQNTVMREMISALLPDIGVPDNLKIYGPSPISRGGKTGVHAVTPYGEVPLADLSFGYQTMTAWLADIGWRIFQHYPGSANPLREPAVVLVDEIDLHLHPKWQRQLRQKLGKHFPAVQFIATAHSPLMAQAYMSQNLAVVRRVGEGVKIENEPKVVASWRLDEVITSELFDLPSAFPPEIEALYEEQRELVAKPNRTRADQNRLRELESILLELPQSGDPEDDRAMSIIRRAAAALERKQAGE